MLLASVSDVLSALGFEGMTDITFAAQQAVDAAEAQLASMLNTEFEAGTYTDMFFVRRPPYEDGPGLKTEFRLRRGFVTALTSMNVNSDVSQLTGLVSPLGDWNPAIQVSPNTGSNINVTAFANLAAEKGMVADYQNRYRNCWVQIVYTAGFPPDPSDNCSYLLSAVPTWLQQAAKLCAILALADSPSLEEAQIKVDKQLIGAQYSALISRKTRYFPNALLPV